MACRTVRLFVGVGATALAAIFGGPANAGYYNQHYDPNSFLGDAVFFVPDPPSSCLSEGPGFHPVNGVSDPCQGVGLVSVSTTATDGTNTATLTFGGPLDADDITGMVLGFNEPLLQGINSNFVALQCTGNNILCDDFHWFIEWDSGLPQEEPSISSHLLVTSADYDPLAGLDNQVLLFRAPCDGDVCEDPALFATANTVTFAQIPEPGTLTLILGGLAAGWLSRKRKIAA